MKRKLITTLALICVLVNSVSVYAGYNRVDWNRINKAYQSKDLNMLEKFVRKDETNIIDQTVDVEVVVDEDTVVREINNAYMLGVGHETAFMSRKNFFKDGTIELAPGYVDLANRMFDLPIVRWGGHNSNYDSWLNTIGEIKDRKSVVTHQNIGEYYMGATSGRIGGNDRASEIGPIEYHKINQAINPNIKYIVTMPWYKYEKEDLVNYVRFFLDERGESEWGDLRASLGVEEPIDVECFELGNELYITGISGYNNERTTKQYIKDAREVIAEVKKYHPEAKFGVPLRGNHQVEADPSTYNNWNIWLAEGLGDVIDYACPHLYYCGYEPSYFMFWFYDQYQAFVDALGEDCDIKFLVTEHAKWQSRNDSKEFSTHSLSSVLAISQMLNLFYETPFIEGANYYGWYNSTWAIAKYDRGDWLLMGIPQMMGVYLDNLGDKLVLSDLKSDTEYTDVNSTQRRLTGIVMKDKEDLVIIFTNRLAYVNFEATFDFNNEYTLVEETIFTSPNIFSFVSAKDTEDVFTTTVTEKNIENFSEYTIPNKSLVVLRLKKQK